jgi:hypothetical protein
VHNAEGVAGFPDMDIGGPNGDYGWQASGPSRGDFGGPVNIGVTPSLRRRRRSRVNCPIIQLSGASNSDISDYETEDEEDGNTGQGDLSGLKHVYRDDTWSTNFFTYDPKPKEFLGRMGTS